MSDTAFEPKTDIDEYLQSEFNRKIYHTLTGSGKELLFEPLDFFNLFYEQFDKMADSKKYPSVFYDRLYKHTYDSIAPTYSDKQLLFLLVNLWKLIELKFGVRDSFNPKNDGWDECHSYIYNRLRELNIKMSNSKKHNQKLFYKFDFNGLLGLLEDLDDNLSRIELVKKAINLVTYPKNPRQRYFHEKCQTTLKCLLFLEGKNSINDYETQKLLKKSQKQSEAEFPVFKKDAIDDIFNIIRDYFSIEDQPALRNLLLTGKSNGASILFKGNGAVLCHFFKTLYSGGFIKVAVQADLERWIAFNFVYMNKLKKEITIFRPKYVSRYISETGQDKKGVHLIEIQNIGGINEIIQLQIKNREQFNNF